MDNNIINGFLDMSSFLLVEGTADSEADYGILKICHEHVNMTYDEDDAESCSCEYTSGSDHTLLGSDQEVLCLDHEHEVDEHSSEHNDADYEGKQRRKGYKMWLRDNANLMAADDEAESKDGININREVMDQMEDWLFWETCMAVGYP